jgi:type III secretory pathway lipoprotein EscJ
LWAAAGLGSACAARPLVEDLPDQEAQRCVVVLRACGFNARTEKQSNTRTSRVLLEGDPDEQRQALQLLAMHALPRQARSGFATSASSIIPSASEERAAFMKGLSGEVEALLESVDGVVSAEALVNVPERRPFARDATEAPSASVVLTHAGEFSPLSEAEIRETVVRAVGANIAAGDVAVLLKPLLRAGEGTPIVRFERDRVVEHAFLAAVGLLVTLEGVTLYLLRVARRAQPREA